MQDIYELPKLRFNISFTKVAVVIATIFTFFVLPISFISNVLNDAGSTSGRVAGVATNISKTNIVEIPILNIAFNLNSQSGLLIIGGLILVGISAILMIYLLLDNAKYKKFKY